MMFPDRLVVAGSFRRTSSGGAFEVRLPWYRALPLSCVDVSVTLDDLPVPGSQVSVVLEGSRRVEHELRNAEDAWWFVTDPMTVEIDSESALTATSLGVCVGVRIPYIVAGEQVVRLEERLVVPIAQGEAA